MQKKSIYKYAAEAGVPAGLYLTLMSACLLLSIRIPSLPMLLLPLAIGFPFILWGLLSKVCREEPTYRKFSSVWLGGIYTIIFGTLICTFLSALYVMGIEPGFVGLYVQNAIDTVESSPMSADYQSTVTLMREALNAHILPSSMEFLITMAWFTCFTGSILSMIIAFIMSRAGRKIPGRASF